MFTSEVEAQDVLDAIGYRVGEHDGNSALGGKTRPVAMSKNCMRELNKKFQVLYWHEVTKKPSSLFFRCFVFFPLSHWLARLYLWAPGRTCGVPSAVDL